MLLFKDKTKRVLSECVIKKGKSEPQCRKVNKLVGRLKDGEDFDFGGGSDADKAKWAHWVQHRLVTGSGVVKQAMYQASPVIGGER